MIACGNMAIRLTIPSQARREKVPNWRNSTRLPALNGSAIKFLKAHILSTVEMTAQTIK